MKPVQLRILFLGLFIGSAIVLFGQNYSTIRGKIVDYKSGAPIPFATIRLMSDQGIFGVISNSDGDFQIPSRYKTIADTMMISCIGYITKKISMRQLDEIQLNQLRLEESSTQLQEVIVKGKRPGRISAVKIIKEAIKNIPDNYPLAANSYIAYYRDYQLRESQYINLNEAIVEVFDKGFDSADYLTTDISLYDYKINEEFERDSTTEIAYDNEGGNKFIPGARLFPFGGNELAILRIHDAIRNNDTFSFSFVKELRKDFIRNHGFKLIGTVYLNETRLYHITFQSLSLVTGKDHFATGSIYIEHGNFAIHKLEYFGYEKEKSENKLLYNIKIEYARSDTLMYLNYISFNNFFSLKNPFDFKVIAVVLDTRASLFEVTFNHRPEVHSVLDKNNYDFRLDDRKLKIKKIETSTKDDRKVNVYLSKRLPSVKDPSALARRITTLLKGIKDMEGREVNKVTYVPVNQFRELFVQKRTNHSAPVTDSLFIQKNLPLTQSAVRIHADADSINYWMNTPLKREY